MKRVVFCLISLLTLTSVSFAGPADHLVRGIYTLDGRWTLDFWPQDRNAVYGPDQMGGVEYRTVCATVPGNVELDLYEAGLAPKPELGGNTQLLRVYEGYQWRYSRDFTSPIWGPDDSVVLRFAGIDCFAEVYVNGNHVGSADNMLIAHEFDVTDVLLPAGGINHVEVYIRSSVEEGRRSLPPVFSNNWQRPECTSVRRAPHSYGWDIMPRLVSAGLWRGVELEVLPPVHIRDAHWMTSKVDVKAGTATVMLDWCISLPVKYQTDCVTVHVSLSRGGRTVYEWTRAVAMHSERVRFNLEDVDFWWPRGYGEPALYDAVFELLDKEGKVIDRDCRKFGIRTVQLDRTPTHSVDKPGRFCFIVNGEPVFIHGSNWTPMDALHSRDPQHLEKTFELVTDLNCNMLRCWGGNVYEDEAFYDLCDANGVMVWQDFSMGCSSYPQSTEFQLKLEKELYAVVQRLRRHCCVALWAGNNEDDEMIADDNFSFYRPDPNMDRVSRETIPHVLFDMDPTRPYLASSPYWSPEQVSEYYSSAGLPERHLWGPRGYYKAPFYTTEANCIFASETGYHGMPDRESLEKMFPEGSVYPWTDEEHFQWKEDWLTKAVREYKEYGYTPSRNDLMINQVKAVFGEVPSDLDRFIFASQSVQAEAMKFFVERFRGRKFDPATGILWWNIRDGWPIISDAVVDWYFSRKMAYYYIRNVQRNVCAMITDNADGSHAVVVTNDTRHPAEGKVTVTDIETGRVVYKGRFAVPANGRNVLAQLPEESGQGVYLIRYTGEDGGETVNHYLYGTIPFKLDKYRLWMSKVGMEGLVL